MNSNRDAHLSNPEVEIVEVTYPLSFSPIQHNNFDTNKSNRIQKLMAFFGAKKDRTHHPLLNEEAKPANDCHGCNIL